MLNSYTRIPGKNPHRPGFRALKERWLIAASSARIPANAVRLAVILAKHFNAATRACFPSIPTLAKVLALCERTIQRLLEALARAGLIRVGKGGGRCASTYEMLVADGQALAEEADISTLATGSTRSTTASNSPDAPPSSPSRPSPRIWAGLNSPLWRKLAPAYRAATGRNPPLDARGGWFFSPAET